jgi:hypothetical protein
MNYQDKTVTQFLTWTPHFAATWDATHDGKTAVRAGFNQYVDPGFLSIANFVGRSLYTRQCKWNTATMQYDSSCQLAGGVAGSTVGQPLGVDAMGNPIGPQHDMKPPRTTEVLFGLDREVLEKLSIGGEFVYRAYDNLYEDVETNATTNLKGSANLTDGYQNGQARLIYDLETPEEAKRRYYGFTLTGAKNVGRFRMLGSWTISKTEGVENSGFTTPFLDNPAQSHFFYGPLSDDRRHQLKIQMSYDITDSLLIGGQFVYLTGTPYSKFYFNDTNGTYSDFRAPRGTIPVDPTDTTTWVEGRLPDFTQLDLRASYSVRQWTGQNLMAVVDIFNVLNTRTTTTVETRNLTSGATKFGDTIDKQIPFQVRVGLRYVY